MPTQSASRANHAIGVIFLAIFGAVWLVAWCLNTYGRDLIVLGVIIVCTVALCAFAVRLFRKNREAYGLYAKTVEGKRASLVLGIVNVFQWSAIFALAALLPEAYAQWFVPIVIFVVGIHFIPLASVLRYRPYYLTAAAIASLAVLYPLLSAAGPASPAGVFGIGAILWATALGLLAAPQLKH
jgi:hypothetical protein